MSEPRSSPEEIAQAYERLIARFVAWAQEQDDVRAAVVIGSRARTDHPADEWADLDVLIATTDPQRLLATPDSVSWECVAPTRRLFVKECPRAGRTPWTRKLPSLVGRGWGRVG